MPDLPGLVRIAAWVGFVLLAGCSSPKAPPDLILVSLDTTRADRFAAVAASQPEWAPLWTGAARFDAAASPTPITLPAHGSMLSGLNPNRHGLRNNGQRLGDAPPLLQERLQKAGYRTGAFVSAYPLDPEFGLGRGFETYDQPTGTVAGSAVLERPATTTVPAALAWWNADTTRPRFLMLHLFDAHAPYLQHDLPDGATARERYDAEIGSMGRALAPLLETLSESGRPFVLVLTGDHGEGLGDHDELDHGLLLYDSTLLVPMLWWAPDRFAPGQRAGLPRLVDLAPTLLELAGAEPLAGIEGVSLLPTLAGQAQTLPAAYAESFYGQFAYGTRPIRSLREGSLKWIGTGEPGPAASHELYRWQDDPTESVNLAADEPAMADALQLAALDRPEPANVAEPTQDALRTLKSLGYLGQSQNSTRHDQNPAALVKVHQQIMALQELDRQTQLPEAIRLARQLVADAPDLQYGRFVLGDLLAQSGANGEAIESFKSSLRGTLDDTQAHYRIAELHMQLGQDEAALPHWQAVLALDPARTMARTNQAVALANLERWDEAWTAIEHVLKTNQPPDAGSLEAAIAIAERTGRYADAATALRTLSALPGQTVDPLRLGGLALRAGQADVALKAFQGIDRNHPAADLAGMGAAAALTMLGRQAEAEALRASIQQRNPAAYGLGLQYFGGLPAQALPR
ncbi:MAG: sulfatase-like hydrolase/transferase [Ahniella sp.]|nr:sulfatase-like hydrolase/transferase [Ahniella sp.]